MIHKTLRRHQWKAYIRHPMFIQDTSVKILIFFLLLFLSIYILPYIFTLDSLLLKIRPAHDVIDTFSLFLFCFLIFDFNLKLSIKKNQSLQIAPYLTLPIKRSKLFNFLLIKEFYNIFNLYPLLLIIPFTFKAISPAYGTLSAYGLILALYLLNIASSLLVSIINSRANKVWYKKLTPAIITCTIYAAVMFIDYPFDAYFRKVLDLFLNLNPTIWLVLFTVSIFLWVQNKKQTRERIYREMQGHESGAANRVINIPFLSHKGEVGQFINLELKMLSRSKQLKSALFGYIIMVIICLYQNLSGEYSSASFDIRIVYWTGFMIGGIGLFFSQYLFMSESSYFDGLMTRRHSFVNLIRAKYYLFLAVSTISLLLSFILVILGKIGLFTLISIYLYYTGLVYCLMFQNGVYNKRPFDIFTTDYMGWKSSSASQFFIGFMALLIPNIVVGIISIFSKEAAILFMFVTGLIFVLGSNIWLKWTCRRVMRKKYIIMDGFRSNG